MESQQHSLLDVQPKNLGVRKSKAIRVRALAILRIIESYWRAWFEASRGDTSWHPAVQTIL